MTTQEILQQCKVEGSIVKLPEIVLERDEYLQVKKKLELIGGKWKGGNTKGFVFDNDPTELLQDVANGEDRNLKKEYQFFATPSNVARMMIDYIPVIKDDTKILEPSAGDGAIIKEIRNYASGGHNVWIDCYEAMELNVKKLAKLEYINLLGPDFLVCDRKDYYDIVIANPPFTKNQDIDHTRKMFEVCKPGGTVVTLSSLSWSMGEQKKQVEFREWLQSIDAQTFPVAPGEFKESGTGVGATMIVINKAAANVSDIDVVNIPENIQPPLPERKCRVCGCTDNDNSQCIAKTDEPCHWVEDDLCSACQTLPDENTSLEKNIPEVEEIIPPAAETIPEPAETLSAEQSNDMNFFQQLFALMDGVDVNMHFKRIDGKMELKVVPEIAGPIKPVLITGAPEDFDNEFFKVIHAPVEKFKGLKIQMDAFHKSAVQATEDAKKAPTEDKAPSPKPAEEKPAKPVAKKETPKKEEKPKVVEPSLF